MNMYINHILITGEIMAWSIPNVNALMFSFIASNLLNTTKYVLTQVMEWQDFGSLKKSSST